MFLFSLGRHQIFITKAIILGNLYRTFKKPLHTARVFFDKKMMGLRANDYGAFKFREKRRGEFRERRLGGYREKHLGEFTISYRYSVFFTKNIQK